MKNRSPLNTLIYYSTDKGMDRLYIDFKSGLNAYYRDYSKEYSEEEKVIYYYPGVTEEDNTHIGFNFQADSIPYSFDHHVERKVNKYFTGYNYWLEELFELESPEKTLAVIRDHKSKINNLFGRINTDKTVPRKALRIILGKLSQKEALFNKSEINADSLLVNFADEYSKKLKKYSRDELYIYLKSWEKFKNLPESRSLAKREFNDKFPRLPKDGTLSTWEKRWVEFRGARTDN